MLFACFHRTPHGHVLAFFEARSTPMKGAMKTTPDFFSLQSIFADQKYRVVDMRKSRSWFRALIDEVGHRTPHAHVLALIQARSTPMKGSMKSKDRLFWWFSSWFLVGRCWTFVDYPTNNLRIGVPNDYNIVASWILGVKWDSDNADSPIWSNFVPSVLICLSIEPHTGMC